MRSAIVTGASRGIGAAIARRLANDGYRVLAVARSLEEPSHAGLSGTLKDLEHPRITPMRVDMREEKDICAAVDAVAQWNGRLDVLVCNASAINLDPEPPAKVMDLLHNVNVRGTQLISQHARRHMYADGRMLAIAPPILLSRREWIAQCPSYAISKYSMTLCMLGMSCHVHANTLWPKKTIATAATDLIEKTTGTPAFSRGRNPAYFAKAASIVLHSNMSGLQLYDEDVLEHASDDAPTDLFVGP